MNFGVLGVLKFTHNNSLLVILNELHILLLLVNLFETLVKLVKRVLVGLREVRGLCILWQSLLPEKSQANWSDTYTSLRSPNDYVHHLMDFTVMTGSDHYTYKGTPHMHVSNWKKAYNYANQQKGKLHNTTPSRCPLLWVLLSGIWGHNTLYTLGYHYTHVHVQILHTCTY